MSDYADGHGILYLNTIDEAENIGIDYTTDTFDYGQHLNVEGAEKLSLYLGEQLVKNFRLTDHRQDESYKNAWQTIVNKYYEDNSQDKPVASQQTESKYSFELKGIELKTDGDLTEYTSKLGEPSGGYYEAKSCAFEGMDKFYYYDSVTLQGYQKDGNDKLYSITLMDDAVKTKEGVRIGDKKDKVLSAYGSDYTEADGQLLYESGNTRLSFVMKDDEVQSIIYSVK